MKTRFYMKEVQYHDGECYVTFNIVDLNELKNEISVAITREGKISVVTYHNIAALRCSLGICL